MNSILQENREMKDSGIEWIGKIPKEWEVRKLSSKYKFHTGFTPDTKKTEFYDDEGFSWVTISDLNKSKVILDTQKKISELGVAATKGTLTPKGSLLYSFKLSVGQVGIAGKDLYTNEAIASFTPNQNECLNFLYYSSQVCIIQKNANENIYGAKLLNQELIKSAKIVIPPLDEQQAIANYLDKQVGKIDKLIADQNQAIENWKGYKQSLITETVTKGLNPNAEMKDSGIEWIGKIPKSWEIEKIKNKFLLRKEVNLNEDALLLSLFTHIGVKPRNQMEEKGNKATTVINYSIVKQNDIIVNKLLAWMGAIAISDYEGVCSPDYDVYTLRDKKNCAKYYHYLFRTNSFKGECYRNGKGIMLMRLRTYYQEFKNIYIPKVPISEQQAIVLNT